MALIDSFTFLDHKHDVSETTYSQRLIDMKAMGDYGVGRPMFFVFTACGAFTKDLRAIVIGIESLSGTGTPVGVHEIGNSGIHPAASLTAGEQFYVQVNQTDIKYRYLGVLYVPSEAGTGTENKNVGDGVAVDVSNFAPPPEVGVVESDVANAITTFIASDVPTHLTYKYKNADKITE